MDHKWQDITEHLYKNINPIGGDITSRIGQQYIRKRKVEDIWVEFDMNDFIYEDPFYGEQKSTAPFRMTFSIWDLLGDLHLDSVLQLEDKSFYGAPENKLGSFSNSLSFTIPEVKFGKLLENNFIEFEMTYCLTNSESYGMMDGTIKDHIQQSGKMKTVLKCKDLIIQKQNSKNIDNLLKSINPKHYDVSKKYVSTELRWSNPDYTTYCIPFASRENGSIDDGKNKASWWTKLFGSK